MRKQVLACLLLGALGAQAQEKFVVEGQLKNIPDGTVFYLMKQEGVTWGVWQLPIRCRTGHSVLN